MKCMAVVAHPYPGVAAWICERDENHDGAHREGRYQWADSRDEKEAS